MWYSLKDKNEYSAEMVAKVLCYNAGGKDMSKPTKKEKKICLHYIMIQQ
mgnify:CR=1 FL=1